MLRLYISVRLFCIFYFFLSIGDGQKTTFEFEDCMVKGYGLRGTWQWEHIFCQRVVGFWCSTNLSEPTQPYPCSVPSFYACLLYCHVSKLFLPIFIVWVRAVVARRLTTWERKLWIFIDRLILSTHKTSAPGENKCWENRRNYGPPRKIQTLRQPNITTITNATIMTINTRACIFASLVISKSMWLGNTTFDFDCGIDLSPYDGSFTWTAI